MNINRYLNCCNNCFVFVLAEFYTQNQTTFVYIISKCLFNRPWIYFGNKPSFRATLSSSGLQCVCRHHYNVERRCAWAYTKRARKNQAKEETSSVYFKKKIKVD